MWATFVFRDFSRIGFLSFDMAEHLNRNKIQASYPSSFQTIDYSLSGGFFVYLDLLNRFGGRYCRPLEPGVCEVVDISSGFRLGVSLPVLDRFSSSFLVRDCGFLNRERKVAIAAAFTEVSSDTPGISMESIACCSGVASVVILGPECSSAFSLEANLAIFRGRALPDWTDRSLGFRLSPSLEFSDVSSGSNGVLKTRVFGLPNSSPALSNLELGYSNYSAAKELLGQDTGSSGF
jgi:hypothetical protein